MNNFSKFLLDKEEAIYILRPKHNKFKVYFVYLAIVGAFFLLFPMLKIGRHGLAFWLFLVFYLFILLAQSYLSKLNYYLLTDRRIIYLKAINKNKYKLEGAIYLKHIDEIKKHGRANIVLIMEQKKYYLMHLEKRDKAYEKIENML